MSKIGVSTSKYMSEAIIEQPYHERVMDGDRLVEVSKSSTVDHWRHHGSLYCRYCGTQGSTWTDSGSDEENESPVCLACDAYTDDNKLKDRIRKCCETKNGVLTLKPIMEKDITKEEFVRRRELHMAIMKHYERSILQYVLARNPTMYNVDRPLEDEGAKLLIPRMDK